MASDVATLTAGGSQLSNWETVMVQQRWAEPFHLFQLTMAEPPKASTPNIGDVVSISLGGIQAIKGAVTNRQSAMDRNRHSVQIIGKSLPWQMVKSSLVTTTKGIYDGLDIVDIATNVCAPFNIPVRVIGDVSKTKFTRCRSIPGELAFDFLEHHARMVGVIIGSDELGNLNLIGLHNDTVGGTALTEGGNIERINVIWSNETIYQSLWTIGQRHGDDDVHGTAASALKSTVMKGLPQEKLPSFLIAPAEYPTIQSELQSRADFEARWHNGTMLTVFVTVAGWTSGGSLWKVGNAYQVNSPTHLLNGISLKAKSVTFTQDNDSGTLTTLELVLPWFLNGLLMQGGIANPNA